MDTGEKKDKTVKRNLKKSGISKDAIKRRMGSAPVDKKEPTRANSTLDQLAVMSAMRNSGGEKFR